MTKSNSLAVLALGLAFAAAAAAQEAAPIATISELRGPVSVNQGDEFAPAVKGMRLKPGDRVMVQNDGEAELKFDDDCELEVDENRIITIPDRSTCKGGSVVAQQLNPEGGAAIGSTGTGNGGVWTMAAIVAAIDIWWLNEDDHDTVSP